MSYLAFECHLVGVGEKYGKIDVMLGTAVIPFAIYSVQVPQQVWPVRGVTDEPTGLFEIPGIGDRIGHARLEVLSKSRMRAEYRRDVLLLLLVELI